MAQESMHRCPYCFAALPTQRSFWLCPVGLKDDGSPCAGSQPQELRDSGSVATCPDHDVAMRECCYAEGCRRQLPERWSEVTTTTIAMAGTKASGKTVYIYVAAMLLMGWGKRLGLNVSHYDQASRLSFEQRFGILDGGSALYGSTEPERRGQVVTHQEPILLRCHRLGTNHVLVLRDVAGENLQDAVMDTTHFRFLANADGILLLVDPTESPAVQRALPDQVVPAASFDPAAVWGNLYQLQLAINGPAARLVPFAVTLSKFDIVRKAAEHPNSPLAGALSARGSRMFHDPSLRSAGWDTADGDLLHLELLTLHQHLGFAGIREWAHSYGMQAPVRMFAMSSLGGKPTVGKVADHGIIPFRCLDPIKWFLAGAGVLPTDAPGSE